MTNAPLYFWHASQNLDILFVSCVFVSLFSIIPIFLLLAFRFIMDLPAKLQQFSDMCKFFQNFAKFTCQTIFVICFRIH